MGTSVTGRVGGGDGGLLFALQSGLHIAFSLQYAGPPPQKPYPDRHISPGQDSPSQGPMVGCGVVGVYEGSAVVGEAEGLAVVGSEVVGESVGDDDGFNVVGLSLLNFSIGDGVGD